MREKEKEKKKDQQYSTPQHSIITAQQGREKKKDRQHSKAMHSTTKHHHDTENEKENKINSTPPSDKSDRQTESLTNGTDRKQTTGMIIV
jgi:hypothetical protein